MEFDIKNSLLKSSIGDNRLAHKNIKAGIDQSLVSSMAQKSLDMKMEKNLNAQTEKEKEKQKEKEKAKESEKNKDKKAIKLTSPPANDNSNKIGIVSIKQEQKIVRDPLALLKLL